MQYQHPNRNYKQCNLNTNNTEPMFVEFANKTKSPGCFQKDNTAPAMFVQRKTLASP